jgi:hypothetical protein
VATARRSCDIRIVAESPIHSDAQLRLKANIDRAIRKGPRRQRQPQAIVNGWFIAAMALLTLLGVPRNDIDRVATEPPPAG